MKGVMRFREKGNPGLCNVGLYHILRHFTNVAYELDLPSELAYMHLVLHVPLFKKCIADLTIVVPLESVGVKESLSYKDVTVEILDRYVRKLRNKEVALVKVL
ncbi:hypothetical protein MTR67_043027 [Solanum verrucosum]|uniref:Tf2-1-like SH3-like domain-containing protein n=1 Tax=Solanum verrucosum TaxID=315347 RepID=A0AAF0UNP1_SOLVR|nr:hypothetical protein MTR67_043027 [Solanum verrucosum]